MGNSFTDDQLRFLRHTLDVLSLDVKTREAEIKANDRWHGHPPLDEIDEAEEVYLAPLRELFDKVQGLGHKLVIVGLASLVETTMRLMLQHEAPLIASSLPHRASYGTMKTKFAEVWGRRLEQAKDFPFADLVRVLANDFKHRDGFADLPTDPQAETFATWQAHQAALAPEFDWNRHVNATDGKIDFGILPIPSYMDRVESFLDDVQNWPVLNPNSLSLR